MAKLKPTLPVRQFSIADLNLLGIDVQVYQDGVEIRVAFVMLGQPAAATLPLAVVDDLARARVNDLRLALDGHNGHQLSLVRPARG